MKKKLATFFLVVLLVGSMVSPVFADSKTAAVAIGADNSESQLETVYDFFGIKRGSVEETTVTNKDERKYLEGAVSLDKIGTVALSSVYVQEKKSGGIKIESHNINWVTDEMYESALLTAGIKDAEVIVAAYTPVSGTGALTGIYKAYEVATGKELDEDAKTTAVEEVVVTGELKDAVGDDAINIINSLKSEIAQTKTMNDDEIRVLIVETAETYDTVLSEAQVEQILGLVNKFNELNMDPDTFLKLMDAGQKTEGFFVKVQDFFQNIGDFFSGIFK